MLTIGHNGGYWDKMFSFGGKSSVDIYSAKTGKKLCKIEAPQKWWSGLPIPLLFVWVSYRTVWKDPEAIRKWAWQQAYITTVYLNDIGITSKGGLSPPTFRGRCLVCGKDSVVAMDRHWRWSKKSKLVGFFCLNRACRLFRVLVPIVLFYHMDEMPMEYLPVNRKEI